jgi:integrase
MPKKIIPLSDMQVNKAKPKSKAYKLADGGGLYLLVTVSGGKLWRYDYRFDGIRKTISFGQYPVLTLAEARQCREDARKLLAGGQDPGAVKKHQRDVVQAQRECDTNTFEKVSREWHEYRKPEWSENHAGRLLTSLEKDVFPFIGDRPITSIKTPDLVVLLQRVAARTLETAYRLKIAISGVFQHAVLKGLIEYNPAASLRGVLPTRKHKHMAAPTEPKAVAGLVRAIDGFSGTYVVKCALQLTPLVFVRPGELRKMQWVDLDLEAGEWKYFVTKTKKDHLVPLPLQAIEILRSLQPLTGQGRYVFPSIRSPHVCMSENTVNASLRRLGFTGDEIVAHGFRAMARTLLHEVLGFTPDAIEAQLAHAVPDRLGRAYNRTTHLAERRRMMQQWADYLDGLKSGAKVIPIRQAG